MRTRRPGSTAARSGLARSTRERFGPLCEGLESRVALSATLNGEGILVIVGTPGEDTVGVDPGSTPGSVVLSGVDGVANGTEFTGVLGIRVDLRSGNDTFSLTGTLLTPENEPASVLVLMGNGRDEASLAMAVGTPEVRGGNSQDTINGGPAGELLKGGRGIDSLFGNAGADRLEGQLGRDLLVGGPDDDDLFGGFQADVLWGNGGEDLLNGGRHRDIMWGGLQDDTLVGDQGADRFNCAPEEAEDFTAGDVNFDNEFDPDGPFVLPPIVFWDRVAAGEDSQTGQIGGAAEGATDIFVDSFAEATPEYVRVVESTVAFTTPEREAFQSALLVITNAYSPPVLADPFIVSPELLASLWDDLAAAAPTTGNMNESYSDWVTVMLQAMIDQGYVTTARGMVANAPATQGHLFGGDGVFNLTGWN